MHVSLVLAWATTIHKFQDLTLDNIVVAMKGQAFDAGQAYIAFSCVKSLQGLHIKNFNPSSIKVSKSVVSEMEKLNSEKILPPQQVPQVVTLPRAGWIKIGNLNVRGYASKQKDVASDTSIAHSNIMCFTEPFLKPHQNISSPMLNGESSVLYRCHRVTTSNQDLSNCGVMIACASSLCPQCTSIPHPPILEVESIIVTTRSNVMICVIPVYH